MNDLTFTKDLDSNIAQMKALFSDDSTFICRIVHSRGTPVMRTALFFIDGMVNNSSISENLVQPLSQWTGIPLPMDETIAEILQINDCPIQTDTDKLMTAFLYGDTIVLTDGDDRPAVVNTKGFSFRSPSEPDNEKVLRGPREGFTEAFMPNLSLIRRRLRTPQLCFSFMQTGSVSHTAVSLCYIRGIVDETVLQEVKRRIEHIDLDAVLDANYLKEIMRDDRCSPFPTIGMTERPDIVAAKLLEGRVAVVVDGTPVVLTVPHNFQ